MGDQNITRYLSEAKKWFSNALPPAAFKPLLQDSVCIFETALRRHSVRKNVRQKQNKIEKKRNFVSFPYTDSLWDCKIYPIKSQKFGMK
jgi:hypothetical protein